MKELEELRAFFRNDRFATLQGMEIDSADEEGAVCSVRITPDQLNGVGIVQGGLLYTLADFAFAAASNGGEARVVTLSSAINFLRPPKRGAAMLFARASRVHRGKTVCVYGVRVYDELGTDVAAATMTGYSRGKDSDA
jgi:acyl-CoA thioesterase